jgi:uncharacterized protein involved in exopolysaccharide biosynthesis
MAQLFRDQCRDAWEEEQGRGMFKLWLRVLPDLVSTSIAERLAALNERKSMTDKLASMSRFRGAAPFATFATVFVVVFLIVFLASVTITVLMPEMYASTARIVVAAIESQNDKVSPLATPGLDPYLLETTFEIIQSEEVLKQAIEKLNLNERWGKIYNNGRVLNPLDTVEMLKQRIRLGVIRDTHYITITAYSADNKEAADIANAVAQSYRDYRLSLVSERSANQLTLRTEFKQQEVQIQLVQSEVEALGAKANITSITNANPSPLEQVYWDKKRELDRLTESQKELGAKVHQLQIQPSESAVSITDSAEPSQRPARPNKTLNIVIGAFAGIFLGAMAGGMAVTITHLKKRSRINPAKA